MKKVLSLLFLCVFLFIASFIIVPKSSSDQLDDVTKQINDLTSALNMSINATKPLQSQLDSMKSQIADIKNRVAAIEQDIAAKKKNIDQGYADLAKEEIVLNRTIRDYYIKSYYNSPLLMFLSGASASQLTQVLAYQKAATDQDKVIITNIAITVQGLEEKKKILENEQVRLTAVKASLDEQSAKLDKIVTGAKAYQANLSGQIAQLTAQQQALISAKQASLGIPISAYTTASACVDDRGIDPGFSPALAFFTYGVPNRVGLNQYGAWGRAKANQSTEDILAAYYPGITLKKDYDTGATINVNGYGPYNVEEYVKRIYEMPASWTDNDSAALKAQAVAARSYGLAHRGGICATDSCQVFKPDPKTDNNNAWINAVNATAGWVLVDGSGNPVSTQYSSTHGGYILNLNKFDGLGGNPASFSDLSSRAYDGPSNAKSPWFYCDWGARADYHKTAWMRPSEVADIVNTLLLLQADSSTTNDLYQTDQPPPSSIPGSDNWSQDKVKQELRNRNITPFDNITSVSVSPDFNSGTLTSITLSGDGRSTPSFNAGDFKNRFNLRAPANIQIVGPLYNVEQR